MGRQVLTTPNMSCFDQHMWPQHRFLAHQNESYVDKTPSTSGPSREHLPVPEPRRTVTPKGSAVTAGCPDVSSLLLPRRHVPNMVKALL